MSSNLINPAYKSRVYFGLAATCLSAGAAFAPWEPAKIIGLTVLTGVVYKFASNMIACRDCIYFFTVDEFCYKSSSADDLKHRLVSSLDPNLNAVAYAIDTWRVTAFVGFLLALVAQAPIESLKDKITSTQLLPYFALGAVVTFALSHGLSWVAEEVMDHRINVYYQKGGKKTGIISWYYEGVPGDLKAKWAACRGRNITTLSLFALGGMALTGAILAARIGKITLPNPISSIISIL